MRGPPKVAERFGVASSRTWQHDEYHSKGKLAAILLQEIKRIPFKRY
jgi:hypothetical protein